MTERNYIDEVLELFPKLNELSEAQMDCVREAMSKLVAITAVGSSIETVSEHAKLLKPIVRNQMAVRSIAVSFCAFYLAGGFFGLTGGNLLLAAALAIVSAAGTFWLVDIGADKLRGYLEKRKKGQVDES